MSHPSGTGPQDGAHSAEDARRYSPALDDDPVTEVIEIPAAGGLPVPGSAVTDERRYTAPGFDAGSTQIIDRVPDDQTEYVGAHRTGPQAIRPTARRRPRWRVPILLLMAALTASAVVGLLLLKRAQAAEAARENAVRSTIETFDTAVRNGDLATLREVTCGQTRETYVDYDDTAWSDTFTRVAAAKQYPVVASIDEVVINGDHAEANVTSYMAFDPATTSTRSFDLQFRDDQWKICQAS